MKLPFNHRGGPDYGETLRAIGMTARAIESILEAWPEPMALMNATDIELRATGLTSPQVRRLRGALGLATLVISHPPRVDLRSAEAVADFLTPTLAVAEQEVFVVLAVNAGIRLIQANVVAIGNERWVALSPIAVFRDAVRAMATGIILAHNHPAGDPTPSDEDILMTGRLAMAGKVLGIRVWDHIVLGRPGRFCSLREEGFLGDIEFSPW